MFNTFCFWGTWQGKPRVHLGRGRQGVVLRGYTKGGGGEGSTNPAPRIIYTRIYASMNHLCIYASMHLYLCIYAFCIHASMYLCIYASMRLCIHLSVHHYLWNQSRPRKVRPKIIVYINIYVYIYIYSKILLRCSGFRTRSHTLLGCNMLFRAFAAISL